MIPMHLRVTAVLLLSLAPCGAQEAKPEPASAKPAVVVKTLSFSAIPNQSETRLKEKFDPIAAYLSDKLGVPVKYVGVTRYEDAVEQFKTGDVQLAWFGGLTGVQARHAVKGARAIAQGEEDRAFKSYIVAHKDSGLEKSAEFPAALQGKKFTFGSAGSTSGRLMPEHFIRKHTGKPPEEFFGRPNNYSGSHDKTLELVASGAFEAGVVDYTVYEARVKEGKIDPAVVRVIWESPTYVDYNFTAHPVLEEAFGAGFTDKLQAALLAMTDEKLLSAFPRKKLIKATNDDFATIAKLARELQFIR